MKTPRDPETDAWLEQQFIREDAIQQAKQALGIEQRFRNYYECVECDEDWVGYWSCAVDEECPECRRDISPYDSVELDDDDDA